MLAETVGRSVHPRRLAVRAEARRLPSDREQDQRARPCSSRETATTTRRSSRKSRARWRRSRSTSCIIDGEVVVLDPQGKPSFCAPAAAGPARFADRHEARRGRVAGDVLRVRLACVRGLRSASAAAHAAQSTAARGRFPDSAPCERSITSSARARRFLAAGERAGTRGDDREARRLAVPRRPHRRVAQDQGRADRRLRHRRVHRRQSEAAGISARCSSPTWWAARSSTQAARAPGSTTPRSAR